VWIKTDEKTNSRISKTQNFIEIILLQDFKFVIYQKWEYFMFQYVHFYDNLCGCYSK